PTAPGATLLTVTPPVALPEPVSSSVTVTLTDTASLLVPVGLSSAYTCVAVTVVPPAASDRVADAPTPQATDPLNVSSGPGPVKLPVSVTVPPGWADAGDTFTAVTVGATLATATAAVPLTEPVSSSVTVTLIDTVSDDVPVGLSSA